MFSNSNNSLPPSYPQSNTAARDASNRVLRDASPLVSPPALLEGAPALIVYHHLVSFISTSLPHHVKRCYGRIPDDSCRLTWVPTPLLRSTALSEVSWHHPRLRLRLCLWTSIAHILMPQGVWVLCRPLAALAQRCQGRVNRIQLVTCGRWVRSSELSSIMPPPRRLLSRPYRQTSPELGVGGRALATDWAGSPQESRGGSWSSVRATRDAKDRMESRVAEMIQVRLTSNDFVADWVFLSHRLDFASDEPTSPLQMLTRLSLRR